MRATGNDDSHSEIAFNAGLTFSTEASIFEWNQLQRAIALAPVLVLPIARLPSMRALFIGKQLRPSVWKRNQDVACVKPTYIERAYSLPSPFILSSSFLPICKRPARGSYQWVETNGVHREGMMSARTLCRLDSGDLTQES